MEANLVLQFANTPESKTLYAINFVILIIFLYFYFSNSMRLIRGDLPFSKRQSYVKRAYASAIASGGLLMLFFVQDVPLENWARPVACGAGILLFMMALTYATDRLGISLSKDKKPPE